MTQGLRRLTKTRLSQTKERLNKTQEGLNETARTQREDSTNKLEQSKTSLGKTLKPRVAETEETRLDKRWPKLMMRNSSKENEGRNNRDKF